MPSRIALLVFGCVLVAAPQAQAQRVDLSEIFSNDKFYRDHSVLQGRGDVSFLASVWSLPGAGDSTRVVIGISLSNEALQFVRTADGTWEADYAVTAAFDGLAGEIEQTWEKRLSVGSFDETLLTGETIVFQTQLRMLPGAYDVALTVRDRNANDRTKVEGEVEVMASGDDGVALGEPILLKFYSGGAGKPLEYIVHPSHYFPSSPSQIDFLIGLAGAQADGGPYRIDARLVALDEGSQTDETVAMSELVTPGDDGSIETVMSLVNEQARFGTYELEVTLADGFGAEIGKSSTVMLIAGSADWITNHWDDALTLIKYEATRGEMRILKDIDDARERVDAWNCFWRIRDPIPATATNERLQEYFGLIQIANDQWTSTLRPGYLSDRGRVFITLGRPDNIERNPVPSGDTPFEVWLYHRYGVELIFADRIGFDNYQLETVDTYQRELQVIERRKRTFLQERASVCPLLEPAYTGKKS